MKTTGMRICCAAVIVCLALGATSAATFINGGFEDGTTNGWTCRGGLWSDHPGWPQNFNDYTNPAQFKGAIVTPGNDLIVGTNLNRVFNGNYALRVNDSTGGCHVSTAVQTVSNWTGTNIYFAWAAVLQSSHGSNDSDNFTLQLRDETLGSNLITRTYSSYNAGPIFTITNQGPFGDWSATPWQIEQLDVSAYIGDTFTVSVLASDCAAGGHAGYVYVDCFGGSIPTTNTTVTITVNVNPAGAGSATGGGTYPIGTNVVLTATPSNGWLFVNWNDGETNNARTITVVSDITYTANFSSVTSDGWLAVSVTPETGSWSLTAPAGYTGPTAGTGSLAAVSAATGAYTVAWGQLAGYIAPAGQTQVVSSASTSVFSGVYQSTSVGWLTISVTPETGSWALSAPAGYTGPTVGTGSLAAVSAVTGDYGIAWGPMTGYVAPSNQTQSISGGTTSLFSGVYLMISSDIGTPEGVAATEGTYTNKIRVIWQGVAGALGYEIWRSQTNDTNTAGRITDIPLVSLRLLDSAHVGAELDQTVRTKQANVEHSTSNVQHPTTAEPRTLNPEHQSPTYTYDDYAINPINAYYYWVRAKTSSLISPMSYVGMGYAALSPEQATGTADIAVSDAVYLPVNVTNLSYAGTVSCRLANLGPDALNAAGVAFDFHMVPNAPQVGTSTGIMVWIGSAQSNMTLSANGEELIILTPSAKRNLTVRGDLNGVQQVKVVVRHLSTLTDPNLANNTTTAAGSVRIKTSGINSIGRSFNDYDGDGKADGPIYRNTDGMWAVDFSGYRYQAWLTVETGLAGLTPVPGDYDGDGITDLATYNRLNGWWTALLSSTEQIISGQLGGSDFVAVPCDFDGDAKTDPVVYHNGDGYWYGASSADGYSLKYAPGFWSGYFPVPGDYDGDGRADPAAYYNEQTGVWVLGPSSSGYLLVTGAFGGLGWITASADYDGDGKTDPAVYNPSTAYWQVLLSSSLDTQGHYTWWGSWAGNINGIPVPADYDGDGKADLAVYHQDTGIWELFLSTQSYEEFNGGFGGPEFAPAKE